MILTVGRIVHITEKLLDPPRCMAAIVTAVDDNSPYTGPYFGYTLFAPTGSSIDTATRHTLAIDSDRWHDPKECPS